MRKILRYPRDCFQIRWCIRGMRGIGRTHGLKEIGGGEGETWRQAQDAAYRKETKFTITAHRIGAVIFWETNPCPFSCSISSGPQRDPSQGWRNRFPRSQTGRNLFRSRARALPIIILNGPKCLRLLHAGCTTAVSIYSPICSKT